jgi:hypothetical protein
MPNWFECVGNLHSKITIYSEIGWHVGNTLQDIYVSSDCWKYVSIVYGKHATILQTKSISDLSRRTACWKQFRKRVSCNFGNSISDTFRTHLLDSRRSQVWSCPMDFQISTNSSWHWLYGMSQCQAIGVPKEPHKWLVAVYQFNWPLVDLEISSRQWPQRKTNSAEPVKKATPARWRRRKPIRTCTGMAHPIN